MKHPATALLAIAALLAVGISPANAQSQERPFTLVARDGVELEARISLPSEWTAADGKVVVLLHGSGPQSMDQDLTAVTRDGKSNLFFKDLSEALSEAGFAVLRYNKRSYQMNLLLQRSPEERQSEAFLAYAANPLERFVEDAKDAVQAVRTEYPEAEIYLLGHSQGAYIALQVASQTEEVTGVALIGFALSSTDVLIFEQTVYRPLALFERLDPNADDSLDEAELAADDPVAASLRGQMGIVDLDEDGSLSRLELQAGNLSNLMLGDMAGILREQEAAYPRPAEILSAATFKVAFFQGLWDNQTPAYNTKAVELVARHVWSKDNFRFFYFPELGHALDARERYDDLFYDTIDPEAKATLVRELRAFF